MCASLHVMTVSVLFKEFAEYKLSAGRDVQGGAGSGAAQQDCGGSKPQIKQLYCKKNNTWGKKNNAAFSWSLKKSNATAALTVRFTTNIR